MKRTSLFLGGLLLCLIANILPAKAEIIDSGSCGENLTWEFNNNGTLTISGTGKMDDLDYGAPWISHANDILTVQINNGVTSIGDNAFYGCSDLTSINIPESITSIGDYTFCNCTDLTYINIPENVTSIGEFTFSGCASLTSINIPKNVTSIGDYAFSYCTNLTTINIPEILTNIGDYTFKSCTSLISIDIPKSVTSIGDYAFCDCTNLTTIDISPNMTNIGESAFFNCLSLTSIDIPETLTNIGESAFMYCTNLTSINIPESVTSIGDNTFYWCSSLTSIQVENGNPNYCSENGVLFNKDKTVLIQYPAGKKETTYNIPENVTNIGDGAFGGCTEYLTSINIPESVTRIGDYAFSDCVSLTQMTVLATIPPAVASGAFDRVDRNIPVYVPAGSLEAYKTANIWREFNLQANIPGSIEDATDLGQSIIVCNGEIIINSTNQTMVSLYDLGGRLVYHGYNNRIAVPQSGIYMVQIGQEAVKVMVE